MKRVVNVIKMRDVCYEPYFETRLAAIEPNARRADELIRGTEWVLSRYPKFGTRIAPNSHVWAVTAVEAPTISDMVIYYSFDEQKVYFLSIELSPDEP